MTPAADIAVAAGAAVVAVAVMAVPLQRRRLARRLARRVTPWTRHEGPVGQVLDAEEWPGAYRR